MLKRRRDRRPDTATGELRDKRLRQGMLASVVYRSSTAVAPLLIVPVALHALGRETFGLWMTVVAATALLAFADLGLGNGLMTELSHLRASGAPAQVVARTIGSSYGLLMIVAATLSAVGLLLVWLTPWTELINWPDSAEIKWIASVCLLTFLANVPASLVVRVMFANQESAQSYLWQSSGPLTSLLGAYLAHQGNAPAPVFVLAATCGPLVANVACTAFWFASTGRVGLRPNIPDSRDVVKILRIGGSFLAISLLMGMATNIDLLLISSLADAQTVTDYSVPWRAFGQVGLMLSLLSLPFWAAAGEALASGDTAWVERRASRLALTNLGFTAAISCACVAAGPELLHLWVGDNVKASYTLLAGLGAWWCVMAAMYPYFMAQNGAGVLRPQILGWIAFTAISVAAKVLALRLGYWTLLPTISVACYLFTLAPAGWLGYRHSLRRAALASTRFNTSV